MSFAMRRISPAASLSPCARPMRISPRSRASACASLLAHPAHACAISKKEKQLIEQYAGLNDLTIDWHYVATAGQLLPALAAGLGDIVLAQDQALADGRANQTQFTYAWADSAHRIIQRRDDNLINQPEHLIGREIAAYRDAEIWPLLMELKQSVASLRILEVPPHVSLPDAAGAGENW